MSPFVFVEAASI